MPATANVWDIPDDATYSQRAKIQEFKNLRNEELEKIDREITLKRREIWNMKYTSALTTSQKTSRRAAIEKQIEMLERRKNAVRHKYEKRVEMVMSVMKP